MKFSKIAVKIVSRVKVFCYSVKYYPRFYLLLLSFFALFVLFLKLVTFDSLASAYSGTIFFQIIQAILFLNTMFIFFFLPSYPIFFLIFSKSDLKLREKMSLSTIFNFSFHVIIGYLGNTLKFSLNGASFFYSILIFYLCSLLIHVFLQLKNKENFHFPSRNDLKKIREDAELFTIRDYLSKKWNINGFLLTIFICLIIVLFYINIDIFGGTDPWYHVGIIRMIISSNSLPLNEYFGSMGFQIIGVVFTLFSGMDYLMIPNMFIIFSIPLTFLLIYCIMRRVFSNNSLVIFGLFLLSFSSIGFQNVILQYWPTMIVFIQGFSIFLLLYIRLKQFIKEKKPSWGAVRKNIGLYYSIILIIFIAMYLSHSLIALIFLISYSWMYLIYFTKNFRRGFDLILMIMLSCAIFVFFMLNTSTGHFLVFIPIFNLEWYFLLLGAITVVVIGSIIVFLLSRSMDFKRGNFVLILLGKKFSFFKLIERFFIPLICILTLLLSIAFFFMNVTVFNLNLITVFSAFGTIIIVTTAFWGLAVFQSKPKGKPLMLWFFSFSLLILFGFIFDYLSGDFSFFSRIFYLSSPIITIGFVSYLYKLIKMGKIRSLHVKLFFIFIVSFSSFTSYFELTSSLDFFSVNKDELSAVNWYVNNTDKKGVLIVEFGWNPVFAYYDYPFNEGNNSKELISTQYYVTYNSTLIFAENHISENGTNVLRQLKSDYKAEVYLLLTNFFLSIGNLNAFETLDLDQINQYYTLPYLNRIFAVKRENGEEIPYYWVI